MVVTGHAGRPIVFQLIINYYVGVSIIPRVWCEDARSRHFIPSVRRLVIGDNVDINPCGGVRGTALHSGVRPM